MQIPLLNIVPFAVTILVLILTSIIGYREMQPPRKSGPLLLPRRQMTIPNKYKTGVRTDACFLCRKKLAEPEGSAAYRERTDIGGKSAVLCRLRDQTTMSYFLISARTASPPSAKKEMPLPSE